MKTYRVIALRAAAALAVVCALSGCGDSLTGTGETEEELTNPDRAMAVLEAMTSRDTTVIQEYVSETSFVAHDPTLISGREALIEAMLTGAYDDLSIEVLRTIEEGGLVALHSRQVRAGVEAARFDILRFSNELVVEHWINVQPTAGLSPDGHTMLDGAVPEGETDEELTESNQDVVIDFSISVLIQRDFDVYDGFFDSGSLIQHDPNVADGSEAFRAYLEGDDPAVEYWWYHHVISQNDFVLVLAEGTLDGQHVAFFDLFRLADGLLAERWSVAEAIPPDEAWA
ncbi:MAG: hypothetical protein MJB57_04965, partial [Gemmatimonadetes bacterium]|nr:hypothetical protein [Gemmatimonadota bacterium]